MLILKKILEFISVIINIITNKFYLIYDYDCNTSLYAKSNINYCYYFDALLDNHKPKPSYNIPINYFNNSKWHRFILYILGIPDIYLGKISFTLTKDKNYYKWKYNLNKFRIIHKRIKLFNYYLFIYSYDVKGLSVFGFYKLDYALGLKGLLISVQLNNRSNCMEAIVSFNHTLYKIAIETYLNIIFKIHNKIIFKDIIEFKVQDNNTNINYILDFDSNTNHYKFK